MHGTFVIIRYTLENIACQYARMYIKQIRIYYARGRGEKIERARGDFK